MEVKYTNHARIQIKRRKFDKVWVEEAIKNPDIIKKEGTKFYAIKRLNGITIMVVYVKVKYINIVTVFKIRK